MPRELWARISLIFRRSINNLESLDLETLLKRILKFLLSVVFKLVGIIIETFRLHTENKVTFYRIIEKLSFIIC